MAQEDSSPSPNMANNTNHTATATISPPPEERELIPVTQPLPNGTISNNSSPYSSEDENEEDSSRGNTSPEIGTSASVMKLWEGRTSTDQLIWLNSPPKAKADDDTTSDDANSQLPRHAITLQHRNFSADSKNPARHQKLDTIILRGPELRRFLDGIIPNVASLYDEVEHGIVMRAPFRLLYWHLDRVNTAAAARQSGDEKLAKVAKLLRGVLRREFRDLLAKRKELVSNGEMNFDTVWTLFKPGSTCVTEYGAGVDEVVAVKVQSVDFGHDPMGKFYYRVKHVNLGWEGESLGWQDGYTDIMEFNGRRKIQDLDIFPIEFHQDKGLIAHLVERGRRFAEIVVSEPRMMSFNGESLDRETSPMWWQGDQKKMMSERVVLDARAYNHYFRRLFVKKWMKRDELKTAIAADNTDESIFMYCCPELYCFALQRKKWTRVWIDGLDEVEFNDSAYHSLVLPGDYKELLLAFAEAQIDGYGFDDVIAGKGQGILMLLAGPPGIGKTLTAEAIAEHMKRPLYSVSAGELGASAGGMETELDRVLELSTRWNAILLLDEADVFLERRMDNDLQRNSIVSVFLRKLEYYRGIMFLTTNRIHSFDEAFKSRIHIAMRYPDLDATSRRLVWDNFLKKAESIYQQGMKVSKEELDELSQKTVNGREIRNIVKTAQLLASRAKEPLGKKHLDMVWRVEHEDSVWQDFGHQIDHKNPSRQGR